MAIHKVAVISDTHGILRQEVIEVLKTTERILHGGDITSKKVLDKLSEIAEVTAVRGNGDKEWAEDIPREVFLELYGRKIYMIHNKKYASDKAGEADIVIYGHSHKYEEKESDGALRLNPGSCGPRRFGKPLTMAVLTFDTQDGTVAVEKIDLSPEPQDMPPETTAADSREAAMEAGALQGIVAAVVGDLKRGKSVDAIMKKRGVSRELAEQISQIYFTHPGVDVQGVLDRLEIAGL